MKRLVIALALLAALPVGAQTNWKNIGKLIGDGSYKTAYAQAEKVFKTTKNSTDLLASAYYMSEAAGMYQDDALDSAKARYRSILPRLEALERAVCYAFLGVADSALMDEALLKQTPASRLEPFCVKGERKGVNLTPTAFDVVAWAVIRNTGDQEKQLALLQKLIDFHQGDDDAIRIRLDVDLLDALESANPNSWGGEGTLQRYINKYRGSKCPMVTDFYRRMASWLADHDRHIKAVRYCDTAIALFPKSEGAAACADIRNGILARWLSFVGANDVVVYPGRPSLCKVNYFNLSRIHFSLYPYDGSSFRGFINNPPKPVKRWTVDVVDDGTHRQQSALFDLPPLTMGNYILVASTDGKEDEDCARMSFDCCDFMLNVNGNVLQMVDAVSGEPVSGQQVVGIGYRDIRDTAVTDANGCFRFSKNKKLPSNITLRIRRGGHTFKRKTFSGSGEVQQAPLSANVQLVADRPVYRPGDTVHISAILYESDGLDGRTLAGREAEFRFRDPNGKERAKVQLVADAHGVASTIFVLPADGLAGRWVVWVQTAGISRMLSLRVEEYKQPKFMVSLDDPSLAAADEAPAFGRPVTIRGRATAYSGASLSGAKVKYHVDRQGYWRWNWFAPIEVANDSTTASADGTFLITFTPQPDSSIDLSRCSTFQFGIFVEVTDLNGETHDANTFLTIGRENVLLQLDGMQPNVRSLREVSFSYTDLSGRPLKGKVSVNVMRLLPNDTLRLELPIVKNSPEARMALSRDEFRRLFPAFAYSAGEAGYRDAKTDFQHVVIARTDGSSERTTVRLDDKKLPSGVYRIVASDGTVADTLYTLLLTLPDERRTVGNELLWADVDTLSVLPGGRLTLRYGSAYEGARFYYTLSGPNGELRDTRWLPAGRRIKSLSIPVDSTLLGGFNIHLMVVREGVKEEWRQHIDVPFEHKKLQVDITTFRDKLQPGQEEEWTIKVKNATSQKGISPLSTILMTMYDDALSSYGTAGNWKLHPWRGTYGRPFHWVGNTIYFSGYYEHLPGLESTPFHTYEYTLFDGLLGSYGLFYPQRRMYKNAPMLEVATCLEVADEAAPAAARDANVKNSLQGNVRARTASKAVLATAEEEEAVEEEVFDGGQPEVQLRTNLNTLAFFVADLRTDSTGTATYRFRVPELLTRWRLQGLAFTDDLRIGTLDRTLVTSKPLMVQPNIPRFLRHGDSTVLMAKVVLNEELRMKNEEWPVEVHFLLTDAATGDTLCRHTEHTTVMDVAQVTFDIELPRNVYVATYTITATAHPLNTNHSTLSTYSDGERGQIPVVSDRQAVTVSRSLYINGKGEKTIHLPLSTFTSPTAEPHFLGAELTASPIWLAVKAMPYLQEAENPSSIYLANRLYVNTLAASLVKPLAPMLRAEAVRGGTEVSLQMNEDVKRTLLEATPWLRDAEAEADQRRQMAVYFDSTRLAENLERTAAQLSARQNSDGGWGWMPESESSLWTTQQILQTLGHSVTQPLSHSVTQSLSHSVTQALNYLDREQQRHYEKYIKPYLKKGYKWQPDNIDYLYTRSFFGKGSTEAYRFYYSNALKNYKTYDNLYTQAQLALIFQRHGDRKAARDIIRRLKEKSLQSDEMGLYWRDNRSSYFWYQRPIETQALLIRAFREVTPLDTVSIALMQQWLLKQKQTTHWGNDRATVRAIEALLSPDNPLERRHPAGTQPADPVKAGKMPALQDAASLTLCGVDLVAPSEGSEQYRSQRWAGPALDSIIALGDSTVTLRKSTPGIAWASVYYQYTDDMDRIPASETGITLKRSYIGTWKVGERVKVRIEISCDRAMEYLELIDGRPACVEPLSTRAGWRWNQGLRYYVEVKNTATHCYINRLEKGHYVVEYDVYVTNPGAFLAGPVTMQCMYAPEFRATAPAQRLDVR